MRRRLIRFFKTIPDQNSELMDKNEVFQNVKNILDGIINNERLGISFKDWQTNVYRFIPLLYRIQQLLHEANVKNFKICPIFKPKSRHIVFTNSAFHQLYCRLVNKP